MKKIIKLTNLLEYASEKMDRQGNVINILGPVMIFFNALFIPLGLIIAKRSAILSVAWYAMIGFVDAKILKIMRTKVQADSARIFLKAIAFFTDFSDKGAHSKKNRHRKQFNNKGEAKL